MATMKKLLFSFTMLFLLFNINFIQGFSQNNKLIIGNTDSMYYHIVNVNLGPGSSNSYYNLDINNDQITDFNFKISYWGSGAANTWQANTSLDSYDSTYFAVETISDTNCTYMEDVTFYNYDLVKKYSNGDTININSNFTSTSWLAYLYTHMSGWPSCSADDRDYWVNKGFKFIALKKIINGITYWGWVQVKLTGFESIIIQDYAFSLLSNSIIEIPFKNSISIYPNPVENFINIIGTNIKSYSIVNSNGITISETNFNFSKNSLMLDVSILNNDIYLLRVNTDNDTKSFKFVKN